MSYSTFDMKKMLGYHRGDTTEDESSDCNVIRRGPGFEHLHDQSLIAKKSDSVDERFAFFIEKESDDTDQEYPVSPESVSSNDDKKSNESSKNNDQEYQVSPEPVNSDNDEDSNTSIDTIQIIEQQMDEKQSSQQQIQKDPHYPSQHYKQAQQNVLQQQDIPYYHQQIDQQQINVKYYHPLQKIVPYYSIKQNSQQPYPLFHHLPKQIAPNNDLPQENYQPPHPLFHYPPKEIAPNNDLIQENYKPPHASFYLPPKQIAAYSHQSSQDVRNMENTSLPKNASYNSSQYKSSYHLYVPQSLSISNQSKDTTKMLNHERKLINQLYSGKGIGRRYKVLSCATLNEVPSNSDSIRTVIRIKYMMEAKTNAPPMLTTQQIPIKLLKFQTKKNEMNDDWKLCKEHMGVHYNDFSILILKEYLALSAIWDDLIEVKESTKLIYDTLKLIFIMKLQNFKYFIYETTQKDLFEKEELEKAFKLFYIKQDLWYMDENDKLYDLSCNV